MPLFAVLRTLMKTKSTLMLVVLAGVFAGCADKEAEKARADAANKEMKALPETFKNPDYFKKNPPANEPAKPAEANKEP